MTITSVPGVRVGHWTDPQARTGCTVVVLPEPNVTAVEVRGGAPGTRETDLLAVGSRIDQVQAILLTGGSAFGLAAADGVMRELAADGRGHPTPVMPVPLVPAAVVFDLSPQGTRPGPEQGAAAYRAASADPVEMGWVGAGAGTSSAKWRGFEFRVRTGIGSALAPMADGMVVGALVVLNPVGDVFTLEGEPLTGGPPIPPPPAQPPRPLVNTTLVVVATSIQLRRTELTRLTIRAHDAIGACVRPSHTRYDGDVVFASACGVETGDLDLAAEAAFVATGRAIEAAVRAQPGAGEPPRTVP
jgi:L-aminopeptidase/D-esterase-like protein